jgi:hypothetical protein
MMKVALLLKNKSDYREVSKVLEDMVIAVMRDLI